MALQASHSTASPSAGSVAHETRTIKATNKPIALVNSFENRKLELTRPLANRM
jgi:hypothetical protein